MKPLLIGIEGKVLSSDDTRRLNSAPVGGVILFTRNYESKHQLIDLCHSIKQINPELLITVDQEGGRVQRFKEGFNRLPPCSQYGQMAADNIEEAKKAAWRYGNLMSEELIDCGVDLSFAPVVDLGINQEVIGDRAFHQDPDIVIQLAEAFIDGMNASGMKSVLKHFPGHGSVSGDTHLNYIKDDRPLDEIIKTDLKPFSALCHKTEAIMASHVVYTQVDSNPASLSEVWLKQILRQQLGFEGIVFTDDMGMTAVQNDESPLNTVWRALDAGADYVLLCNEFEVIDAVLENWPTSTEHHRGNHGSLNRLLAQPKF